MSVLRTFAGTFATKGAGMVLTFLSGVIFARVLGPAGRGEADFAVSVFLLLLLVYPSLEDPQLFLLGRKSHPPSVMFTNGVIAALLFGGLVLAAAEALIAWAPQLLEYRDRRTGLVDRVDPGLVRLIALGGPLEIARRVLGGLLQGLRDMRAFNLVHLVQNSALLLLAAALVLGGRRGVVGAVEAYLGAMVAGGLAAFVLVRRNPAVRVGPFRPDLRLLLRLLQGGLRIHLGAAAAYVIVRSDQLFLMNYHGPVVVGIYGAAVGLAGYLQKFVMQPAKEVLGSRLPQTVHDEERTVELVGKTCRHVVLLSLLPAAGLAAVGFPLIVLAYGWRFADSYWPLLILLPGSLLWAAAVMLSMWFVGRDRLLTLTGIGVFVAASNVALNAVFVPAGGALAAAATSTFCYAMHLAIFVAIIRRSTGHGASDLVIPRRADFEVYREAWRSLKARLGRGGPPRV
jgi:O-antigen/teichoic acid export membrane protein